MNSDQIIEQIQQLVPDHKIEALTVIGVYCDPDTLQPRRLASLTVDGEALSIRWNPEEIQDLQALEGPSQAETAIVAVIVKQIRDYFVKEA